MSAIEDHDRVVLSIICCSLDSRAVVEFLSLAGHLPDNTEFVAVLQGPQNPSTVTDLRAISRARVVQLQTPGLSAARNVGLDVCVGEWSIFPDDDCWFENAEIHRLVSTLDKFPSTTSLARFRWIEARGERPLPTVGRPWDLARSLASIELAVRTTDAIAVGGFDERLGLGAHFGSGEEVDLAFRLLRAGHGLNLIDDVAVHHMVGSSNREGFGWRAQFLSTMRRGRGYGAIQIKSGIPWHIALASACSSLYRNVIVQHSGAPRGFGSFAGRVMGASRWRLSTRRRPQRDT
jgi:glycosyltransferase involved in cell wall biosynthesis